MLLVLVLSRIQLFLKFMFLVCEYTYTDIHHYASFFIYLIACSTDCICINTCEDTSKDTGFFLEDLVLSYLPSILAELIEG